MKPGTLLHEIYTDLPDGWLKTVSGSWYSSSKLGYYESLNQWREKLNELLEYHLKLFKKVRVFACHLKYINRY